MNDRNFLTHPPCGMDADALEQSLAQHLTYSIGKTPQTATARDWFHALAYSVRDRMVERLMATTHGYYEADAKRVYYLSLEHLLGRTLTNALINLGIEEQARKALQRFGLDLEDVRGFEDDAGLGNGGLGRLAACLMDSLATLDLPGYGYGIRYEFGMFTQRIRDGWQVEHPEHWLRYGNPWELIRPEVLYPVQFYGRVVERAGPDGGPCCDWLDTNTVMAMAYDMPIPGYRTTTTNNLRLWSAKATRDFELGYFNQGNYIQAVGRKTESENLSKVLYPDDSTHTGRELRLKQEYFFVSASLQDILRRFLTTHDDLDAIPDKIAIQLNDTHPALGIAEWMRLLVDLQGLPWERAWDLTRRTFAYTNHTLLPEALEAWPVALLEHVLPRHMRIIYDINYRFLQEVSRRFPGDLDTLRRLSLISEESDRRVRMAHLAIVGSHRVNGVSALHTRLLERSLFPGFHTMDPGRFVNITNGITPRRWLDQINRPLGRLLEQTLGACWVRDLRCLKSLEPLAEDEQFRKQFRQVKLENKRRLAAHIARELHVQVSPDSLFDVQIKRIHEYKRQLLNVLHLVTLYNRGRADPAAIRAPRTFIFAGKAAPAYRTAKLIIKLINDVASRVNQDPEIQGRIRVVFIPNYNVSAAALLIPPADLSEQISTAGMEASGTGNMKLGLNGALTIGTLDGANIEIRDAVGAENFFLFGMTTERIEGLRARGYRPATMLDAGADLSQALEQIGSGFFSPDDPERFRPLVDDLLARDPFFVLTDFADYRRCQSEVEALYLHPDEWSRRAILNLARMGEFSSDRTALEYAEKIWGLVRV